MGWYDSFKGNVAGVNLSGVGDDTGLAAKAFGDAFVSIGKNMNDSEAQKKKDAIADKTLESTLKTNDAKIASENAKSALYGTQNEAAKQTIDNATEAKETKKLDDAFSGAYRSIEGAENLKLFKDNYQTGNGYGNISADAVKAADAYFQSKFNDEAKNVAVSKGYKDFATFAKENEQLVKMADGATMAQLDKYFGDKDMSAAKLAAQENSTKNQIALLNKEQEISNLTAAKNKAEIKAEGDGYGKTDPIKFSKYVRDKEATEFDKHGERIVTEGNKKMVDYKETRGLQYMKQGYNATEAYDLAHRDYLAAEEQQKKDDLMKSDPLNQKKTSSTPQQTTPTSGKSDDFLGLLP